MVCVDDGGDDDGYDEGGDDSYDYYDTDTVNILCRNDNILSRC